MFAITLSATPAFADGPCQARSDCASNQRCVKNACVDEATYEASKPTPAVDEQRLQDDENVRPYVAGAIGGILPAISNGVGVGPQLSLRAGILTHGFQFGVDISPASGLFGLTSAPLYMLEVAGTVGYLIPITDQVSWIVRLGGGGGLIAGTGRFPFATSIGFGEFRADVVGVSIRTSKHLVVELNVPSFRLAFVPSNALAMWVTNVAIDYVF